MLKELYHRVEEELVHTSKKRWTLFSSTGKFTPKPMLLTTKKKCWL
jgi:hypothetical protein